MEPPAPTAGPRAVREYLDSLLILKHDLTPEAAHNITDRWQVGLLRDLRSANSTDFMNIFGKPVGLYLYRSFEDELYTAWRSSISGTINYYAFWITCAAVILFLLRGRFSRSKNRKDNYAYVFCCGPVIMIASILEAMHQNSGVFIILSFIGGVMSFVVLLVLCVAD